MTTREGSTLQNCVIDGTADYEAGAGQDYAFFWDPQPDFSWRSIARMIYGTSRVATTGLYTPAAAPGWFVAWISPKEITGRDTSQAALLALVGTTSRAQIIANIPPATLATIRFDNFGVGFAAPKHKSDRFWGLLVAAFRVPPGTQCTLGAQFEFHKINPEWPS